MATTYSERLDRYQKQRDEWMRNLLMIVSPAVEQVLRKLWQAAEICAQSRAYSLGLDEAYSQLFARSRTWSDQDMRIEIGGEKKAEEADLLLQMVAKTHATVLALSSAVRCKQVIAVPTVVKFFRAVLEASAAELAQSDFFCTFDIDVRAKVRGWIDKIVIQHALGIVPVGLFAKTEPDEQVPRLRALQRMIERAENDIADLPTDATQFGGGAGAGESPQYPGDIQMQVIKPVIQEQPVVAVAVPLRDTAPAPMAAAAAAAGPVQKIEEAAPKEEAVETASKPGSSNKTATDIAREAEAEMEEEEDGAKSEAEEPLNISMPPPSPSSTKRESPRRLPTTADERKEDDLQSVMSGEDGDEPI